jgi:hypothetical protein
MLQCSMPYLQTDHSGRLILMCVEPVRVGRAPLRSFGCLEAACMDARLLPWAQCDTWRGPGLCLATACECPVRHNQLLLDICQQAENQEPCTTCWHTLIDGMGAASGAMCRAAGLQAWGMGLGR